MTSKPPPALPPPGLDWQHSMPPYVISEMVCYNDGGTLSSDQKTCELRGKIIDIAAKGNLIAAAFDTIGIAPSVFQQGAFDPANNSHFNDEYNGLINYGLPRKQQFPKTWCTPYNYPYCDLATPWSIMIGGDTSTVDAVFDNLRSVFSEGGMAYVKLINPIDTTIPMEDPCKTGAGIDLYKLVPFMSAAFFGGALLLAMDLFGAEEVMPEITSNVLTAAVTVGGYFWGKAMETSILSSFGEHEFYMDWCARFWSAAIGLSIGGTIGDVVSDGEVIVEVAAAGIGGYLAYTKLYDWVWYSFAPGNLAISIVGDLLIEITSWIIGGGWLGGAIRGITKIVCETNRNISWASSDNNPLSRHWDTVLLASAMTYDAMAQLGIEKESDPRAGWLFYAFVRQPILPTWAFSSYASPDAYAPTPSIFSSVAQTVRDNLYIAFSMPGLFLEGDGAQLWQHKPFGLVYTFNPLWENSIMGLPAQGISIITPENTDISVCSYDALKQIDNSAITAWVNAIVATCKKNPDVFKNEPSMLPLTPLKPPPPPPPPGDPIALDCNIYAAVQNSTSFQALSQALQAMDQSCFSKDPNLSYFDAFYQMDVQYNPSFSLHVQDVTQLLINKGAPAHAISLYFWAHYNLGPNVNASLLAQVNAERALISDEFFCMMYNMYPAQVPGNLCVYPGADQRAQSANCASYPKDACTALWVNLLSNVAVIHGTGSHYFELANNILASYQAAPTCWTTEPWSSVKFALSDVLLAFGTAGHPNNGSMYVVIPQVVTWMQQTQTYTSAQIGMFFWANYNLMPGAINADFTTEIEYMRSYLVSDSDNLICSMYNPQFGNNIFSYLGGATSEPYGFSWTFDPNGNDQVTVGKNCPASPVPTSQCDYAFYVTLNAATSLANLSYRLQNQNATCTQEMPYTAYVYALVQVPAASKTYDWAENVSILVSNKTSPQLIALYFWCNYSLFPSASAPLVPVLDAARAAISDTFFCQMWQNYPWKDPGDGIICDMSVAAVRAQQLKCANSSPQWTWW